MLKTLKKTGIYFHEAENVIYLRNFALENYLKNIKRGLMKKIFLNRGFLALVLGLMTIPFFCTGCGSQKDSDVVDKIIVIQGDNQCALPGQEFPKEVRLEIQGKLKPGLFGGKGSRSPVAGVKLLVVPLEGSDLRTSATTLESNSGGGVSFKAFAGKKLGDHYLKVIPVGHESKSITIRFINGIAIKGAEQQGAAGYYLGNPIQVEVFNGDGKPLSGVPVFFSIESTPNKQKTVASLKNSSAVTSDEGIAETQLKLGEKTGEYKINVEVADPHHNLHIRGITVTELGLNLTELIVTVLGGLAIFIFGMSLMSDGLQIVAGDKMRSILHFFARNRIVAAMAGMMVTAVIQSSSACTVMVIGFVNAGLLNLTQAIGIVFGANIGTTVTAQIISFKLSGLAFPAIVIGLLLAIFKKQTVVKGWGESILGFGLLFLGMSTMSHQLKIIGSFPVFVQFFQTFDCSPVNGFMPIGAVVGAIGIGALVTLIIQSSSASMGIVLALAAGGLINFYTSVPLILGTNIGTTVTAGLASLAANKRAKQAALAHFLFNVIGSFLMIILFYVPYPNTDIPIFMYLINHVTQGDVFAEIPQNVARHIAMAHTFFNVLNVILLLPFIGIIAKICMAIIPVKDEKIVFQQLEPHLLDTPSIALEQSIQSIRYMLKESWQMVETAMNKHFLPGEMNDESANNLEQREEKIDQLQIDITKYLVELTKRELSEPQANIIPLLMHCTNDAERIADHTENIMGLTKRLIKSKRELSPDGKEEMTQIWKVLSDQAKNVIRALHSSSAENVSLALSDEKRINKLAARFENAHVKRLSKGNCNPLVGIIFIEMMAELEKVGDHLSNIAERAPEIQKHYIDI